MSTRPDRIIVSRHPATIAFVAGWLTTTSTTGEHFRPADFGEDGATRVTSDAGAWIEVIREATADDVRGRVVYGNLPMHLAALAAEVWAVEFECLPPRGQEYTLADMERAGARLVRYCVAPAEVERAASLPDGWTVGRLRGSLNELLLELEASPQDARPAVGAAKRLGLLTPEGTPADWVRPTMPA